jgi:hypothetical protein
MIIITSLEVRALTMKTFPQETEAAKRPVSDLELLHSGLGVLMAGYLSTMEPCLALLVSRQLRLISEQPDLPDPALRPLYLTMAARWHRRAAEWNGARSASLDCPAHWPDG